MKSLILLIFLLPFLPHIPLAEAKDTLIPSEDSKCVWYQGARAGFGRMTLQFYNACGQAMFVYVCLTDRFGKSQLLKSASRIPANGRISFYPFIDHSPKSIHWTAARNSPSIPGPCGEDKKKT